MQKDDPPDPPIPPTAAGPARQPEFTFLTNHSHVLICLAADPQARVRDVAAGVGITERAVQKIIHELEEADIITRHREGRRNRYEVHRDKPLRHPLEMHCRVDHLLRMVLP